MESKSVTRSTGLEGISIRIIPAEPPKSKIPAFKSGRLPDGVFNINRKVDKPTLLRTMVESIAESRKL